MPRGKYRNFYLKRESGVSDSDVVLIDVNVKDPISFITVEYEATNGATSCIIDCESSGRGFLSV